MRKRSRYYYSIMLLIGGCLISTVGQAQPERLLYFPDTGRIYAQMDPGEELLQRNILISNQSQYAVSFDLSFDQKGWNGFSAGAKYSSIYSMQNQGSCYIRLRTRLSNGSVATVMYQLLRGKCYSVYWNVPLRRWDVLENACRRS